MKKNCEEFEAHLVHHLNGELEQALVKPLKEHLASCAHCRKVKTEYRFLMESAERLPLGQVSEETSGKILEAVTQPESRRTSREQVENRRKSWLEGFPQLIFHPFPAYQVVLFVALLLGIVLLWKSNSPVTPPRPVGPVAESPKTPGAKKMSPLSGNEESSLWNWKVRLLAKRDEKKEEAMEGSSLWRWSEGNLFAKWKGSQTTLK